MKRGMKFAFVNPHWSFEGSTYFGCREPHYPLELMYAAAECEKQGHETLLIDAQRDGLSLGATRERLHAFDPAFLVLPSAPSYLFWRCPPPELRVPKEWFAALGGHAIKVLIGPHSSSTPAAALRKTSCDVAFRGEPEQVIPKLASVQWESIEGCCFRKADGTLHLTASIATADMSVLGALDFSAYRVEGRHHRHHVFTGEGIGAELEFARGCPWACTFCNKTLFRNQFRERPVETVLAEVDQLVARGVDYIYFIDEIFGVGRNVRLLLQELARRDVTIGFQTRIDLWNEQSLDLLGRAHCVSMECGIESVTDAGRDELNKNCRISTDRIAELLIYAKSRIPWVQANLILTEKDDPAKILGFQTRLKAHGVWVSEPVPMFPFPGSPLYLQTFGALPDDEAWERAHHYYLSTFADQGFSDIQEQLPQELATLEAA